MADVIINRGPSTPRPAIGPEGRGKIKKKGLFSRERQHSKTASL